MPSSAAIRALALSLCLVGLVSGCDCGTPPTKPIEKCFSDKDCQARDPNTYCDIPSGECRPDKKSCAEGDAPDNTVCCPGQACGVTAGLCVDKYVQCDADTSCTVRGQVCKKIGYFPEDNGCTFNDCDANGKCGEGLTCFNGYCVGEPPCGGKCDPGSVCTPVNNKCFAVSATRHPQSCQQTCRPGTLLVFKDGHNVFNRCDLKKSALECECQPLPPVKANDVSRHSSAATTPAQILVSAYDGDHGDLVLHTIDKSTLKLAKTEWIDGIPTGGAVVGDPDGPRQGRAAAGPDVGQYTALAVDNSAGITHIAYYAVRDGNTPLGDLRYARRSGTGEWKTHVVDGKDGQTDTGDVGLYAALALSSDGFPVIAYFQKAGAGNDAFKTGLKVARAKVREPEKAADWTIVTVESGTRTPPPCASPACGDDEVCIQANGSPNGKCQKKAAKPTDCKTPSCGSDQVCGLNAANAPTCYDSLRANTLAGLPEGNGLMPSIAFLDDKPVVVWYDQNKAQLKGVIAKSDSAAGGAQFQAGDIKVLDDGKQPNAPIGTQPHDVGLFPSVAVGPADAGKRLAVAYFDATARQLRLLTAGPAWADLTPVNLRVIDDGKGNPETDPTLFVGADTSVRFDSTKNVNVLYQDATSGDLRLAEQQQGGATFKITTLKSAGAAGFYANLLVDGQNRFATHAVIKAASASESANKLDVLKVP